MKKLICFIACVGLALASCDMAPEGDMSDKSSVLDAFPVKLQGDTIMIPPLTLRAGVQALFEPAFEEGYAPEEGRYTYEWYLVDDEGARIELSKDKTTPALDIVVPASLVDGTYRVFYNIFDTRHGTRLQVYTWADVASSVVGGHGVYILKDVGGKTDVDYFQLNKFPTTGYVYPNLLTGEGGAVVPIVKHENVISASMTAEDYATLTGTPVDFVHQEGVYWWHNDNPETQEATPIMNKGGAWMLLTSDDIVSASNSLGSIYAHFDDFFPPAMIPAVKNPQAAWYRGVTTAPTAQMNAGIFQFLNNGVLYTANASVQNALSRAYTFPMPYATPMNTSPQTVVAANSATLVWDAERRSIYRVSSAGTGAEYTTFQNNDTNFVRGLFGTGAGVGTGGTTSPTVNVMAMLRGGGYMPGDASGTGSNSASSASSYASFFILRSDTPGTFYLMKWHGTSNRAPNATNGNVWARPIPADADIVASPQPVMASAYIGDAIYYAKGSELWMYRDQNNPAATAAQSQSNTGAQIGAGETIVQIVPMVCDMGAGTDSYQTVTVLTSTGSGYKYYVFTNEGITSPLLNATPAFTLEGTGTPVKMLTRVDYMAM